jgi:hypothetical protein
VVIAVRADGSIDPIAAKGETAPDSGAAKFSSFSEQTQSTDGRAAFLATLSTGKEAIFAESDSVMTTLTSNLAPAPAFELRRIVAEGDAAPGIDGAHYSMLHNPVNNDQGDVAWIASLTGARAPVDNAIWWNRGGKTLLVAREGGKAPGANGNFHQFKSLALSAGPDGAPLFTARLHNGSHLGLWAVDAAGELRLVMQEGATIDLGGGTMREVKTFTVLSLVRLSKTQTRSYAGGAVILRVTFTGAEGQALITVPVPEPAVP